MHVILYVEPKTHTHAVTCSSVTGDGGERWLTFTYRNLGKFMGLYSQNGKLHKKSIRGGHSDRWPFL